MQRSRVFGLLTLIFALGGQSSRGLAATDVGDTSGDQAILRQAGNAMVFQMVFADMAMALSADAGILELAHHIHDLSHRGLQSIEDMAKACDLSLDPHLDATAWRRVGAMREIDTPLLRDQVYLDGQLIRLYEARQEALSAAVHAKHDIIKRFAMRSEPEIDDLILKVRGVVQNWPTSDHVRIVEKIENS